MAQDPLKPRDDGRVRLPRVDGGMNKITPLPRPGGKGANDAADDEMMGRKEKAAKLADELARRRKRFDLCVKAEAENRGDMLSDKKFRAGDQWPSDVKADRNLKGRPCLTVNKLPTFVHQITNDLRQNRPSINISPVGDRGDVEVARMYRGLIRHIERSCSADTAYDTAADGGVGEGLGYVRLLTEYESPDSFDQVIVIRRVRNQFSVYLDPNHQEPDGSDATYGFITELIPRDEYQDKYPDAQLISFEQAATGDMKNWVTGTDIRVAEYFEIKHEMRDLVVLDNGHTGWKDELADSVKDDIAAGRVEIVKERRAEIPKVKWSKMTALEILEEQDWPGKWIPIAKCIGDELDIEGKNKLWGVVRFAKDPQKMLNYYKTSETEVIALQPKAPFVVEEGQIEGHEDEWKTANTDNAPYLTYKGTNVGGTMAPPPQRQPMAQIPAGLVNATQGAAQDMQAVTGIRFDATLQERTYDESGRALRELRRSGDIGSFHFADNFNRMLKHVGTMLVDLIPKVYDTKRMLTILREDDTEEQVQIDPHLDKPTAETRNPRTGKTLRIFNPTYGKYGVTVTTGPSYATKRIESAQSMMDFARALPNAAALIMDLIAKNQDWPGAEEMATRLAKAIPPQFLTPDQKDVPPQVQALMQAMDTQIKQLGMERQQLIAALTEKQSERALEMTKIQNDFDAKLLKIVADVETKQAKTQAEMAENFNTHIVAQIRELGSGVKLLHDMMMAQQQANKPREAGDAA